MIRDIFIFNILPFLYDDIDAVWALIRVDKQLQSFITNDWKRSWLPVLVDYFDYLRFDVEEDNGVQLTKKFSDRITSAKLCLYWTKLFIQRGCTQCKTPRIRKINFAFNLRWCQDCLKKSGISEHVLINDLGVSPEILNPLSYQNVTLWTRYRGQYTIKCYFYRDVANRIYNQTQNHSHNHSTAITTPRSTTTPAFDIKVQEIEEALRNNQLRVQRKRKFQNFLKEFKHEIKESSLTTTTSTNPISVPAMHFVLQFIEVDEIHECLELHDRDDLHDFRELPDIKRQRMEQLVRDYDEASSIQQTMIEEYTSRVHKEQEELKERQELDRIRLLQIEETRRKQQDLSKSMAESTRIIQSIFSQHPQLSRTKCPFCSRDGLKGISAVIQHHQAKHNSLAGGLIKES